LFGVHGDDFRRFLALYGGVVDLPVLSALLEGERTFFCFAKKAAKEKATPGCRRSAPSLLRCSATLKGREKRHGGEEVSPRQEAVYLHAV
jgi:uncharacterized protein with PIN domain